MISRKNSAYSSIHVRKIINPGTGCVSNINFNSRFNKLSISTEKGIFVLDSEKFNPKLDEREELSLNKLEKQYLLVNYDSGLTVAVSSISSSKAQNYLVLKEIGCLQVWNSKSGQIINRLNFNEKVRN